MTASYCVVIGTNNWPHDPISTRAKWCAPMARTMLAQIVRTEETLVKPKSLTCSLRREFP